MRARHLPGHILRIADAAGLAYREHGGKASLSCPFHEDIQPSAVLFASNRFFCSGCHASYSAKEFARRLSVPWRSPALRVPREVSPSRTAEPAKTKSTATFSIQQANAIWEICAAAARHAEPTDPTRIYLQSRGLIGGLETGQCGILLRTPSMPAAIARWPALEYSLIAPLYNATGTVVSIQSRSISNQKPKTRFPAGTRVRGTVFANATGLALLRGERNNDIVLYGEGLTDSIAYALASPIPSLCAPGTPMYVSGLGPWARGRTVVLCADADPSGDRVIDEARNVAFRFGARRVVRLRWAAPAKDACDVIARFGIDRLRDTIARARRTPS